MSYCSLGTQVLCSRNTIYDRPVLTGLCFAHVANFFFLKYFSLWHLWICCEKCIISTAYLKLIHTGLSEHPQTLFNRLNLRVIASLLLLIRDCHWLKCQHSTCLTFSIEDENLWSNIFFTALDPIYSRLHALTQDHLIWISDSKLMAFPYFQLSRTTLVVRSFSILPKGAYNSSTWLR